MTSIDNALAAPALTGAAVEQLPWQSGSLIAAVHLGAASRKLILITGLGMLLSCRSSWNGASSHRTRDFHD